MDFLFVFAGLLGLLFGGEALVRGATGAARSLNMSPMLIGLTVVGFGTSMPEMLVSVDAALRGVPDIAVGNIVGSNIGNILLIVGVSALVWPIRVSGGSLRRDTAVMLAAALVLFVPFSYGMISRPVGAVLFASLIGYLVWAYKSADTPPDDLDDVLPLPIWRALVWLAIGLVALIVGARFLIDGSVSIARSFGVSEAFIGLTIVAIGTSLPELATSLVAAFRRQSEIAIGNIVGSNIFNVLGILGVTAIVAPIPVAARFPAFDLPVMVAATVVLTALLLLRPSIGRITGFGLLTAYGLYIWAAQG
ncbi:calcium/sodium antiporter [Tropicibacter oceani]|uniref:Calcium/sodium antiporter n=1 Tax=Tropicibacter oceani TaxID=3058420 RepID=A0ABY8QK67_9RHOB|nr:calcium/sodium antiporter [Tropicibacter oceani]WGW04212.1 calcium/sodium antiporter [Tropicibacter oceani]